MVIAVEIRETIEGINLANRLTILRILLMPVFVALLSVNAIPHNITLAAAVFAVAGITDFLDGYIARSRNMITPLGKFLDPIADKIIVTAALVCFVGLGWIQSWTVVAILARDLIVSGVRLTAVQSEEKSVIPARTSGKVKTAITMFTIIAIMILWALASYGIITYRVEILNEPLSDEFMNSIDKIYMESAKYLLVPIGNSLMYVCTALTLFSGIQYVWDARKLLKKELRAEESSALPKSSPLDRSKRRAEESSAQPKSSPLDRSKRRAEESSALPKSSPLDRSKSKSRGKKKK
jgi:CDP-diacylglycerol--glycerol-3-phosphate 3-phosphatidyltransferase